MQVRVSYFALLRERAGKTGETIETVSRTAGELYRELSNRYGFGLNPSRVRFAVNDAFETPEAVLRQDDHVIFIVPVSGG